MKITFTQKEIIEHLRAKVTEWFPGVRLFVQYDHTQETGFEVEFSTDGEEEAEITQDRPCNPERAKLLFEKMRKDVEKAGRAK